MSSILNEITKKNYVTMCLKIKSAPETSGIAYLIMKNPSKEQLEAWHKDPKNWKFGLFYYNKEDERLFPPKRVSWMGWTVNFANPKSIGAFFVSFIMILVFVYRKQLF